MAPWKPRQKWNDNRGSPSTWTPVEPETAAHVTPVERRIKDLLESSKAKAHAVFEHIEFRKHAQAPLFEEDLLVAVQACYHQELYPQDVLLGWMLKGYKKISLEEMQQVAEAASGTLKVEYSTTSKKGFAILLEIPPVGFSSFAEDADRVPVDLIEEAAMMVLGGGWPVPEQANHDRISIAAWLHGNEMLQHLTLGCCLAVVNLLLASHSVLGKRSGRLVPYFQSEEYEKQENARRTCPTGLREDEVWVSQWDELIRYLTILLQENDGQLMSARLKNEMRARFHVEFSETALGHVSLGNLLDDPRILEHFEVLKKPPAADLITFKEYHFSRNAHRRGVQPKESKFVPKSGGDLVSCDQKYISGRQEALLSLPDEPCQIIRNICKANLPVTWSGGRWRQAETLEEV